MTVTAAYFKNKQLLASQESIYFCDDLQKKIKNNL